MGVIGTAFSQLNPPSYHIVSVFKVTSFEIQSPDAGLKEAAH